MPRQEQSASDRGDEENKQPSKSNRKQGLNIQAASSSESVPSKKLKVDYGNLEPSQSAVTSPRSACAQQPCGPKGRRLRQSSIRKRSRCQPKGSKYELRSSHSEEENVMYLVKWVDHAGHNRPIITQNANGPCPLIAICNVLMLRGKLNLPHETVEISETELLSKVHLAIMDTVQNDGGDHSPDHIQNAHDAATILPHIKTGLNVNVKFTGVKNFEYTRECLIFDVLEIPLYHGWLLDPQSAETNSAVGNQSYNQLVVTIIEQKSSQNPEKVEQALIAENFLESTASQLTVHGLCELNSSLKKDELAVLFRNNHFNVIYKHETVLCQLVTDQGFLEECDVVWETLSTINGDEVFLDSEFRSSNAKGRTTPLDPLEEQQITQDFLVALSLQDEQNKQQDKEFGWDAYGNALGAIGMTSDEILARQLHVEEQRFSQGTSSQETKTPPTNDAGSDSKPSSPPTQPNNPPKEEEPPRSRWWKCTVS